MYYIYSALNLTNQKKYIGRTKHPERRFAEHIQMSKTDRKNKFYNALRKYGEKNFIFSIEAFCGTEKQSKILEQEYIEIYDSVKNGYNTRFGGEGLSKKDLELLWSDPKYVLKQSDAKKRHWADPEYRQKMCASSKRTSDPVFLKNLAISNWKDPERAKRMSQGRKTGHIQVICLETLKIYKDFAGAERDTGTKRRCISMQVNGKMFRAGKLHWSLDCQNMTREKADAEIKRLEQKR